MPEMFIRQQYAIDTIHNGNVHLHIAGFSPQ